MNVYTLNEESSERLLREILIGSGLSEEEILNLDEEQIVEIVQTVNKYLLDHHDPDLYDNAVKCSEISEAYQLNLQKILKTFQGSSEVPPDVSLGLMSIALVNLSKNYINDLTEVLGPEKMDYFLKEAFKDENN